MEKIVSLFKTDTVDANGRLYPKEVMEKAFDEYFRKLGEKLLKKQENTIKEGKRYLKPCKCFHCKHCYELENFQGECWECKYSPIKDKQDNWHRENEIDRRKVMHWRKCALYEYNREQDRI